MAVLGVIASFLPGEILARFGSPAEGLGVVLIQVCGASYMGFASLNWAARANLIGGIYSRPVALGNFLHFTVVAAVLLKAQMAGGEIPEIMAGVVVYGAFAMWFGFVLFTHPRRVGKGE